MPAGTLPTGPAGTKTSPPRFLFRPFTTVPPFTTALSGRLDFHFQP